MVAASFVGHTRALRLWPATLAVMLFVLPACVRAGFDEARRGDGSPGSRDALPPGVDAPGPTLDGDPQAGLPYLTSLEPSLGSLSPAFLPTTQDYEVLVPFGTESISFTATADGADITIDARPVASGIPSQPRPLALGSTLVSIGVSEGGPARLYEVDVQRSSDVVRYLKASNPGEGDEFGTSLSLDGDTLAVGAKFESSNATGIGGDETNDAASRSGAVYVFVREGTAWRQQAYLKASNTRAGASFGFSVSLSGDTLAVGAHGESSSATGIGGDELDTSAVRSGAVYVFTRAGGTWSQQAYIKASNTGEGDHFGYAVSLSGDSLAVGAYGESSNAKGVDGDQNNDVAGNSGAVYLFTREGTSWSQQAYIKASNAGAGDTFGSHLALAGDTLAVGAPLEASAARGVDGDQQDNSATNCGAVYVFSRQDASWSQQAYLKASNAEAEDRFGIAVALWGDTVAVGAPKEASAARGIDGDQQDNSAGSAGAVYVFTRQGMTWRQQAYLKASNGAQIDFFGTSLALWGDDLLVGAFWEDSSARGVGGDQNDEGARDSGAAYLFSRVGQGWRQRAYIKAANTEAGDSFGFAVSLSGDTVAVGASSENGGASGVGADQADNSALKAGAVYLYR